MNRRLHCSFFSLHPSSLFKDPCISTRHSASRHRGSLRPDDSNDRSRRCESENRLRQLFHPARRKPAAGRAPESKRRRTSRTVRSSSKPPHSPAGSCRISARLLATRQPQHGPSDRNPCACGSRHGSVLIDDVQVQSAPRPRFGFARRPIASSSGRARPAPAPLHATLNIASNSKGQIYSFYLYPRLPRRPKAQFHRRCDDY